MAEHFSFFDAVLQDDGVTYDREYNAQQFTKYFGALVTTGVMKGTGNMLAVSANGSNMVTKINTGIAFVEAKYYENDSFKELTHDTETLGNSRIDRIVIRMDLSTEARYVKAFIKKGVPSTNPVAPTLTQTANLYEISLAQVRVVGGQTFIATNAVTDERGKDVICPWAGSNILPNFNDEALQDLVDNQLTDGPMAKFYSGNLNDLTNSGFYYSNGMSTSLNFPLSLSSSYKIFIEVINAGGWVRQIVTAFTTDVKYKYERRRMPYNQSAEPIETWYPWDNLLLGENRITPTLTANWVEHLDERSPVIKYWKDSMGYVHVSGALKRAVSYANNTLFTLPSNYRPANYTSTTVFPALSVPSASLETAHKLVTGRIRTNGAVEIVDSIAVGDIAFIDIMFRTS